MQHTTSTELNQPSHGGPYLTLAFCLDMAKHSPACHLHGFRVRLHVSSSIGGLECRVHYYYEASFFPDYQPGRILSSWCNLDGDWTELHTHASTLN